MSCSLSWLDGALDNLQRHDLDATHRFYTGIVPASVRFSSTEFDALWNMHPLEHDTIMMYGEPVAIPRWQQAYSADYHFSGKVSHALTVPPILEGIHTWVKRVIDERLNGLLVNWYDASLRHYIGPHRDSIANMVKGCPIVTISLGETRIFRMSPWKGRRNIDFEARDGAIFVLPFDTNLEYTHAVPKRASYRGKRISITLRGFHR